MYTIVSAYGIARAQGARWQSVDCSALTGSALFGLYRRLYITLSTPSLTEPQSIDIKDYQAVLAYESRSAADIFSSWSDTTPLRTTEVPSFTTARAVFTDVTRAGYTVHRSIPGAHHTSSQEDAIKTEMQMSRPGTDMRLLEKYCLVSANGYFYRSEASRDKLYVPEAGKSLLKSRFNHVGILSFERIGRIDTYGLRSDTAVTQGGSTRMFDGVSIALPEVPLAGKSVLLVLAGHLHFITDGLFRQVSDERAVIHLCNGSILERYQESAGKVDWSTVVGEQTGTKAIDPALLQSDAGALALLSHPQTFWVVVDTPNLAKTRLPLRALPLPGQFISAVEPLELLMAGSGYVLEYWKVYQDGEWAVNCSGVRPGRALVGTLGREGWTGNKALTNVPYIVYHNLTAHLLDIVADEIAV